MTSIPSTDNMTVAMIAAALELSQARRDGRDSGFRADRIEGFLVAYKAISIAVRATQVDVKEILKLVGIEQ